MDVLVYNKIDSSGNITTDSFLNNDYSSFKHIDSDNHVARNIDFTLDIPDDQDIVIIAQIVKWQNSDYIKQPSLEFDNTEKIPFYSYILRKSPYLSKKITNLIRLQNEEFSKGRLCRKTPLIINLDIPSLESLYVVLNYLYSDKIDLANMKFVVQIEVYILAITLELERLRNNIVKRLYSPVPCDQLVKLAFAAEQYQDEQVLKDCISILSNFNYKLFENTLFLQLGPRGFKLLMSSDNLQIDELQLYTFTVLYMEYHKSLTNPYELPYEKLNEEENEIIKNIRFCAISQKIMSKIRTPKLDSHLLDSVIRLASNTAHPLRATAWKENVYFKCISHTGLYPTVLIKLVPREYADEIQNEPNIPPYHFSSDSYNSKIMATPIYVQEDYQYVSDTLKSDTPYWTYTIGSYRVISECYWVVEVNRLRRGRVQIGFIFKQNESSLYRNKPTNDPFINDNVIFYDSSAFSFNSAVIDPQKYTINKTHVHLTDRFGVLRDTTLQYNDRIYIDVKCTTHSLNLTVNINKMASETFAYPYKTMYTSGSVIKRPVINLAPYFAMYDYGDSLSIPEVIFKS